MKKYPVLSLVLANLVPILGIFLLDWNLFSILFFYWLESAIIGIYNVPKMLMAQVSEEKDPSVPNVTKPLTGTKITAVLFFMVHYGGFMLGHGVFIFALFEPVQITTINILLAIVSFSISHGISFKTNFINQKEYEKVNLSQQMFAPYQRIVLMHLTIISCAFIMALFGTPTFALVIIVLLKITLDFLTHFREHFKLGTYLKNLPFWRQQA